jgi:hypothetical protein
MQLLPGDIAACFGTDLTGRAISWGTASPFAPCGLRIAPSHVAICCEFEERIVWVESTTLCGHACLVRGRPVSGVQVHRPHTRIADYVRGARVDIYRLADIQQLSSAESRLLSRILIDHFVRHAVSYDMGGAMLSGTRAFQLTRFFPSANLDELFCSELVAAVLMRLGRMNHANPTRFSPGRLLRELVRQGTYRRAESMGRKSFDAQPQAPADRGLTRDRRRATS